MKKILSVVAMSVILSSFASPSQAAVTKDVVLNAAADVESVASTVVDVLTPYQATQTVAYAQPPIFQPNNNPNPEFRGPNPRPMKGDKFRPNDRPNDRFQHLDKHKIDNKKISHDRNMKFDNHRNQNHQADKFIQRGENMNKRAINK